MDFEYHLLQNYHLRTLAAIISVPKEELVYNLETKMFEGRPYDLPLTSLQSSDPEFIQEKMNDFFKNKIIDNETTNQIMTAIEERIEEETTVSFWKRFFLRHKWHKQRALRRLNNLFVVREFLLNSIYPVILKVDAATQGFFEKLSDKEEYEELSYRLTYKIIRKDFCKIVSKIDQMRDQFFSKKLFSLFNSLRASDRYCIRLFQQLETTTEQYYQMVRNHLLQSIFHKRHHVSLQMQDTRQQHQLEEIIVDVHDWCMKIRKEDPEGYQRIMGWLLREAVFPGHIKWHQLSMEAPEGIETILLNQVYFIQTVAPFLYQRFIGNCAECFEKKLKEGIRDNNFILKEDYLRIEEKLNQLKIEYKDLWLACFHVLLDSFTHEYGTILLE